MLNSSVNHESLFCFFSHILLRAIRLFSGSNRRNLDEGKFLRFLYYGGIKVRLIWEWQDNSDLISGKIASECDVQRAFVRYVASSWLLDLLLAHEENTRVEEL